MLLCTAFGPVRAEADDLSDFERAREFYNAMQYEKAIEAFSELVGTDPPRLRDTLLVIESRKYLAASLVFEDRMEAARRQFELLLRAEPDYAIDPLAFPDKVVQLFDSVKRELAAEIRARERAEAEAEARREAALEAQRREQQARLRALAELAQEELVESRNSRWLATVPFGVGQIQNGNRALGRFLAVMQSSLLVASVATYAVHQSLRNNPPAATELDEVRRLERTLRIANYASFGSFLGLVGYGIADAHIRFVPRRTETREREIPDELERWVETELSAGGLKLRF